MSASTPLSSQRPLTRDEVRDELGRLDYGAGGTVAAAAQAFARRVGSEGGDLLHEAVRRALTSRTCPSDLPVDHVLAGIMRSIASAILRSRERRGEVGPTLPFEEAIEQMALGGFAVRTAEEVIEIERVRNVCADAIERLAAGDPARLALIEGIGFDLRGRDLADFLGVSLKELATMRKALKRRVTRLWPEIAAALDGEPAAD